MNQITVNLDSPSSFDKQRKSDSTVSTQSGALMTIQMREVWNYEDYDVDLIIGILGSPIIQPQITVILNRKAVKWLMSICWIRSIDREGLWLSIMLYYAYSSHEVIQKAKLQLLLCGCLYIANKMTQLQKMSLKDTIQLSKQGIQTNDLLQIQAKILEIMDYNLNIPNFLQYFSWSNSLSTTQKQQFFFWAELSLLQNSNIFFSAYKVDKFLDLVFRPKQCNQFKKFFCDLLQTKSSEIILKKYSSKFDPQLWLLKLQ